jgi:hypothetical protein
VGPSVEGTPPTETGGAGGGGQPAGPGTITGPSTPTPVGQGEGEQGHPPDVEKPKEGAGPEVTGGSTAGPPVTGPTPGQIEAGNYKKEHITAAGFPISIENKEGSTRSSKPGVEPAWQATITQAHYGYIKRTEGADDEHVDAFVKPDTAPDHSGPVFVIDQVGADGKFDEHKVMLGYANQLEALGAYKANYPAGHKVGPVTQTTNEGLKSWLASGDTKAPFGERKLEPLDTPVDYDKLEETDEAGTPTGRYATGKVPARAALDDIDKRLEFARAMRECLGV